jgi:hypothetical protein
MTVDLIVSGVAALLCLTLLGVVARILVKDRHR